MTAPFATAFLSLIAALASPGSVPVPEAADESSWSIHLAGEKDCAECPSGKSFRFSCRHLKRGTSFSFSLANLTKRVKSVEVFRSRLVIVGELPQLGNIVTIYDLEARGVVDEFYGYAAALSPQKRYVAFKRYYPRFEAATMAGGDVLLIYDVDSSPRLNRVGAQGGAITPEDAGIPVFPRRNAVGRRAEPYEEDHYGIHAAVGWSEDDGMLAFLAAQEGGQSIAVVVDLEKGLEGVDVCARQVRRDEVLTDAAAGSGSELRLVPEALRLGPKGLVEVRLFPVGNLKPALTLDVLGACEERFSVGGVER